MQDNEKLLQLVAAVREVEAAFHAAGGAYDEACRFPRAGSQSIASPNVSTKAI